MNARIQLPITWFLGLTPPPPPFHREEFDLQAQWATDISHFGHPSSYTFCVHVATHRVSALLSTLASVVFLYTFVYLLYTVLLREYAPEGNAIARIWHTFYICLTTAKFPDGTLRQQCNTWHFNNISTQWKHFLLIFVTLRSSTGSDASDANLIGWIISCEMYWGNAWVVKILTNHVGQRSRSLQLSELRKVLLLLV